MTATDVEYRRIQPSSSAKTREDRGSLQGRAGVVIRASVDDGSLDCSDENEMVPAFVTDIGKSMSSECSLVMLPLPTFQ